MAPETAPACDVQDLYQKERIPKIVVAAEGAVLAFARSGRLLRRSTDGGKTWPVKRMVWKGPSAYPSLSAGKDGTVYLLFERGRKKLYESIAVARFTLDWLADGPGWRKRLGG